MKELRKLPINSVVVDGITIDDYMTSSNMNKQVDLIMERIQHDKQ